MSKYWTDRKYPRKSCNRCGKPATWAAGEPPKHYLCGECADEWHEKDSRYLKVNHSSWMKVWEEEFAEFCNEIASVT